MSTVFFFINFKNISIYETKIALKAIAKPIEFNQIVWVVSKVVLWKVKILAKV